MLFKYGVSLFRMLWKESGRLRWQSFDCLYVGIRWLVQRFKPKWFLDKFETLYKVSFCQAYNHLLHFIRQTISDCVEHFLLSRPALSGRRGTRKWPIIIFRIMVKATAAGDHCVLQNLSHNSRHLWPCNNSHSSLFGRRYGLEQVGAILRSSQVPCDDKRNRFRKVQEKRLELKSNHFWGY